MSLAHSIRPSVAEQFTSELLAVEARAHRRTALVALRGELDLVSVSKVAEVLTGVEEMLVLVDDPDDLVPPPDAD